MIVCDSGLSSKPVGTSHFRPNRLLEVVMFVKVNLPVPVMFIQVTLLALVMFESAKLHVLRDSVSHVSRALHPLMPHVLMLHMLSCLTFLLLYVSLWLKCFVPYVLSCLTCLMPHMPCALPALVPCVPLVPRAFRLSCFNINFSAFIFPCFTALFFYFKLVSFLEKLTTVKMKIVWGSILKWRSTLTNNVMFELYLEK